MVESLSQMKFGIDPFPIIDRIIRKHSLDIHHIQSINYDKEADVLYVKFSLSAKAVDNKALDENGLILLGFDINGEVATLTIIDATTLTSTS